MHSLSGITLIHFIKMAECAKSLINFTKNSKVFWRARTLKTQITDEIFKKLQEFSVLLVIKINKDLAILYFRASYARRYVQLEELKSLFLRKFSIFGIIYHL